nr:RNA-directed DNA polymerase, eukaryota [Tanacetum cinerariifolium]
MESLHLSFQHVVDVGMFKGINLSHLVNLYHMFYADDVVFVGQWCDSNINTLVHVLECFFQASGLCINMCKSKIMGVNVGDEKVKSAASKLGCLILNTSFSYVDTKVGGNMSQVGKVSRAGSRSCWRNIVNKVGILSNQGIKVLDYMRIKLGNGESTAFWDNNWIGGKVLKGSGEFSVASIRKIIDDNRLSTVDTRTLWIKYVPIKVNILAWKIKTEALPTRFNISRRGFDIDSILCPICVCGVESARHVLFSCSLVCFMLFGGMYGRFATSFSLRIKNHRRRLSLKTLFLALIIGVSLDVKPRSVGTIGLNFLI